MKRSDLVRHLARQGCTFVREGASHSLYFNPETHRFSTVPRHREINSWLAKKICQDLGVPPPVGRR